MSATWIETRRGLWPRLRRSPHLFLKENGAVRLGDEVHLRTPENAVLDGTRATVVEVTDWGAHVAAPAAATGQFRAAWVEMEVVRVTPKVIGPPPVVSVTPKMVAPPEISYSGEFCRNCGGARMRRVGTCTVCEDCGESGGCG